MSVVDEMVTAWGVVLLTGWVADDGVVRLTDTSEWKGGGGRISRQPGGRREDEVITRPR